MNKTVMRYVLERYPEASHEIRARAISDPGFRSTCEDYGKCVQALEHWRQTRDSQSRSKADEYRDLCRRIEAEIVEALSS